MIQANELRIGNWVIAPPSFLNMNNHFVQIGNINKDWYNVEPIPLTLKMLEKAGFESDGFRDITWYSINPIDIKIVSDKIVEVYVGEDIIPCEYLHQLQNLYFALKGEELKIEL